MNSRERYRPTEGALEQEIKSAKRLILAAKVLGSASVLTSSLGVINFVVENYEVATLDLGTSAVTGGFAAIAAIEKRRVSGVIKILRRQRTNPNNP